MPPNGVRRSRSSQQLIQTMPASTDAAKRCAVSMFVLHTDAARPYGPEFAIASASAGVSNGMSVATGPKISSVFVRQSGPRPSITVGSMNQPSAQRPGTRARWPPCSTRPPSSRASAMQRITFSQCSAETTAPNPVSESAGSPGSSAAVRTRNASRKRS